MIIQFEISDKSFEILKDIDKSGTAEFRDSEYESFEHFKKSKNFNTEDEQIKEEKLFKERNFCDHKDLKELINCKLIDCISWHTTYMVTDFGKEILSNSK